MPGRRQGRIFALSIAIAATVASMFASAAGAATVTVGSPMKGGFPNSSTFSGAVYTIANVALGEPGAHVTSPVNGTIVTWRVSTIGTGQYAIRVLRPSGGHYIGAGTSSHLVSTAGMNTFTANLPIQTGDLVGLDIPDTMGTNGVNGHFMATGSTWASFSPGYIPDGSPSGFEDDFTSQEMLFNADVQYEDATQPPASPTPASPGSSAKKCKKAKKHKRSAESAKKKMQEEKEALSGPGATSE